MVIKGLLAAALAGLGIFAVTLSDDAPSADTATVSHHYPNGGLPTLFRPMQN